MANHASHAALPYPIKGARYTILIPYLDADGDPTDPTTPDTEISKDDGTAVDTAEEVASPKNSVGMLTLSGAETNCSMFSIAAKAASGPKTTLGTFFPRNLPTIVSGQLSAGSAGGGTLQDSPPYDLTNCFIKTTGGLGGGGTGGANNQVRRIVTYDTSSGAFTVTPDFETTPDSTTTYDVLVPEGITIGMIKTLRPLTDGRKLAIESDNMAHADLKEWLGVAPLVLSRQRVQTQPAMIATTTVNGAPSDQTHLKLTDGPAVDWALQGCTAVIRDAGSPADNIIAHIVDYDVDGSDKEITIDPIEGAGFTIASGDIVEIWPPAFHSEDRLLLEAARTDVLDILTTTGQTDSKLTGLVPVSEAVGSTGNTATTIHLPGLTYGDDEINDYLLVILDVSENEYHARWVEDWVLSTHLATVATLPFTPQNGIDVYKLTSIRRDVSIGGAGSLGTDVTAIKAKTDQLVFTSGNVHADIQAGDLSGVLDSDALEAIADSVAAHATFITIAADTAQISLPVVTGTVNDVAATVTEIDLSSGFSSNDDFYNGSVLVFTSGALKGLARRITDYAGSGRTVTVTPALPQAPSNGVSVMILGKID